jgi:hypothetical protein
MHTAVPELVWQRRAERCADESRQENAECGPGGHDDGAGSDAGEGVFRWRRLFSSSNALSSWSSAGCSLTLVLLR